VELNDDAQLIFYYFPGLSIKQKEQLEGLRSVYQTWNSRINLVSRKDMNNLYLRHVLHALSIARVIAFKPNAQLIDVGTGGGFPGVPLAVLFPDTHFHLVDSVGKKIKAVQAISQELGLDNVTTQVIRAESLKSQFDFILGRGVTQLTTFYNWVKHLIAPCSNHSLKNGIFYLTGEANVQVPINHHIYSISSFFQEPFFGSKQLVHLYPSLTAHTHPLSPCFL
jgi:16S rRNA (guanine527-N7)-methyltransferase